MRQFGRNIRQEYIGGLVHRIFFTASFMATDETPKFCVFTEEGFNGFTVEDDIGKIEEGPMIGAVCG